MKTERTISVIMIGEIDSSHPSMLSLTSRRVAEVIKEQRNFLPDTDTLIVGTNPLCRHTGEAIVRTSPIVKVCESLDVSDEGFRRHEIKLSYDRLLSWYLYENNITAAQRTALIEKALCAAHCIGKEFSSCTNTLVITEPILGQLIAVMLACNRFEKPERSELGQLPMLTELPFGPCRGATVEMDSPGKIKNVRGVFPR